MPFGIAGLRRAKTTGSGRNSSIAGLVLFGLWAVFFAGGLVLGATSSMDVKSGDCFGKLPLGDSVKTVDVVNCGQAHLGESYAELEMPKGEFPGAAAVEAFGDGCGPALQAYSPGAFADESYEIFTLSPTRESWDLGDRSVTCIAGTTTPRTGSIRGMGERPAMVV